MSSPVDGKRSSNSESLSALRKVAQIRFYNPKSMSEPGCAHKASSTYFLACDDACAVVESPPQKNVVCKACTGMVCGPCASILPMSDNRSICSALPSWCVPVGAGTPFACCQNRSVHFARNRSRNTHNGSSLSRRALP